MTVEQMRARLYEQYTGPRWAEKVHKMSDIQVVAIFKRLKLS